MRRSRIVTGLLLVLAVAVLTGSLTSCVTACARPTKGAALKASDTCNAPNEAFLVNITPAATTLQIGGSVALHATAVDVDGNNLSITSFNWSSSPQTVATVNSSGIVNAIAAGTATITATTGSASGNATITVGAGAQLSGRVYDATTSQGVSGAGVTVALVGGANLTSTTTNADGTFLTPSFTASAPIAVLASKTGYVGATNFSVSYAASGVSTVEAIPLVPNATGQGTIAGTVRDATTAQGVSGTSVVLFSGMGVDEGSPVKNTTSGANGAYQLTNVPPGTYTVVADVRPGLYLSAERTGISVGNNVVTANQDLVVSPVGSNNVRAVLTWGANPNDLDSHLTGPGTGGTRFHVYFSQPGSTVADPYAKLDVDNTSGFGPETITISQMSSGTYRYSVHDYTNRNQNPSTALGSSGARVDLYYLAGNTGKQQTFFVPTGAGTLWTVFEMTGTLTNPVITTINSMGYASSSSGISLRANDSAVPIADLDVIGQAVRDHVKRKGP